MAEQDDKRDALLALAEGTLVLVKRTGEVFRRTGYGAGIKAQWVKLVHEEKSYFFSSDDIARQEHSIIWDPKTQDNDDELLRFARELNLEKWGEHVAQREADWELERTKVPGIFIATESVEDEIIAAGKAARAASVDEYEGIFSKEDYPRLFAATEQKIIVPLHINPELSADDEYFARPGALCLGSLPNEVGYEDRLPGHLLNPLTSSNASTVKARLRHLLQADGSPAVEVTYHPIFWSGNEQETKKFFDSTRLEELLTWEQFQEEVEKNAKWLKMFYLSECYDLFFEVRAPGAVSALDDLDHPYFSLLKDPLEFEHEGESFELYLWEHED